MTKETQAQIDKPVQDGQKKRTVEIKPTQVLATALAAVTAAFLGSRLGVAGTVTGAGVASVVSTLGGALYQNSIERTRNRVAKVAKVAKVRTARRGQLSPAAEAAATHLQTHRDQSQLGRQQPGPAPLDRTRTAPSRSTPPQAARLDAGTDAGTSAEPATEVMGAWAPTRRFEPVRRPDLIADATTDWLSKPTEIVSSAGVFARPIDVADRPSGFFSRPANNNGAAQPTEVAEATAKTDLIGPPAGDVRKRRLLMAAGATVLAFVLGMGVVTGIELLDDHPFSGGNGRTTIGSLFGGSTQQPTKHPVTSTNTATNTPTPTTAPSEPASGSSTTTPTTSNTPATTTPSSPSATTTTTTGEPPTSPVTPTGKVGAP